MASAVADANRAHFQHIPTWVLVVRILQIVVATIVMALCAWGVASASELVRYAGIPENEAYGFAFFAFAWTFLFLLYLVLAFTAVPVMYIIWVHLPLECLSVLFWLVSFALLARNASDYSAVESDYIGLDRRIHDLYMATYSSAGLSSLVWLLFIATLVHLSIDVHKHINRPDKPSAAPAPAPVPVGVAPVGVAPVAQHVAAIPPQQPPQGYFAPPPPQGHYLPQPQQPGVGVEGMVSNPSLYGAYQQHGVPAPVSPQTTGHATTVSHPPSVPSPMPPAAAALVSGQGHPQSYELSTVKGDPALAELGSK